MLGRERSSNYYNHYNNINYSNNSRKCYNDNDYNIYYYYDNHHHYNNNNHYYYYYYHYHHHHHHHHYYYYYYYSFYIYYYSFYSFYIYYYHYNPQLLGRPSAKAADLPSRVWLRDGRPGVLVLRLQQDDPWSHAIAITS